MSQSSSARSRSAAKPRRNNPRGEGQRLREEIIEAACEVVAETGDLRALSLRGVAARVGVAATSLYLHFPDVEHLGMAVVERCVNELAQARPAPGGIIDPVEALLARVRGYARYGLEHPGHYQVIFGPEVLPAISTSYDRSPRRATFEGLVEAISYCQRSGATADQADPFRLATLVWAAAHGLVSLRINRPNFPWPPIDEAVDEAVTRLVGIDDHAGKRRGRRRTGTAQGRSATRKAARPGTVQA
jgi:AcrR family transcriptional regulator